MDTLSFQRDIWTGRDAGFKLYWQTARGRKSLLRGQSSLSSISDPSIVTWKLMLSVPFVLHRQFLQRYTTSAYFTCPDWLFECVCHWHIYAHKQAVSLPSKHRWDYSTVSVYILKGERCEGVTEKQLCLRAHCTRPSGGYLATTSRCSFMRQSFDLCSGPAIYFLSTLLLHSSSQSTPHPHLVPLLQNNQPRTPRHHSLVHSLFQLLDLWQIQRNIENPYSGQTESWGVVNLYMLTRKQGKKSEKRNVMLMHQNKVFICNSGW